MVATYYVPSNGTFLVSSYLKLSLIFLSKPNVKKKRKKNVLRQSMKKENNDSTSLESDRFYTRKFSAARVKSHHQIFFFSPSSKVNMKWEYM